MKKTLLDEILEDWYEIRRGLIKEIQNIPAARFNSFRATLETRSVMELVQHVLEVAIVLSEELLRDDTNFQRATFPQLIYIYAPNMARADTQEKLINLLIDQFKDADQRLREKGDLFMNQLVPSFSGTMTTRFSMLRYALQHETHHRGQLTIYERLLGLEPVATKYGAVSIAPPPFSRDDGNVY
jgi:uncharacterized damage-inducible protein DinB